MFGKRKQKEQLSFDPTEKTPVIRCSICSGEQVGGLKDVRTGQFEEVMLIRGSEDLKRFEELTGMTDIPKEY